MTSKLEKDYGERLEISWRFLGLGNTAVNGQKCLKSQYIGLLPDVRQHVSDVLRFKTNV